VQNILDDVMNRHKSYFKNCLLNHNIKDYDLILDAVCDIYKYLIYCKNDKIQNVKWEIFNSKLDKLREVHK